MTTKPDLKTTGKVLAGLLFSTLATSAQAPPPRSVASSALAGENAAATITMDVAAYANLRGQWKYRRTENGTIDTCSRKILGIKKTRTANLTGLAITKDGANAKDFTVTAPAKTTLASGTSTTFSVSFKPNATGTRNAAIHIKSNDADENPFDIKLAGMGAAP